MNLFWKMGSKESSGLFGKEDDRDESRDFQ